MPISKFAKKRLAQWTLAAGVMCGLQAQANIACRAIIPAVPRMPIQGLAAAGYQSPATTALHALNNLLAQRPEFSNTPEGQLIYRKFISILEDEQLSTFHGVIEQASNYLSSRQTRGRGLQGPADAFGEAIAHVWENVALSEPSEIQALLQEHGTNRESILDALGNLSADMIREYLVGDNASTGNMTDTIVGSFIDESPNHPSILYGNFATAPGSHTRGSPRLFVSVDAQNAHLISKYFGSPNFLIHHHTPRQGTLVLRFMNKLITYAGQHMNLSNDAGINFQVGTLAPVIVLSSIEASNMKNYFDLGNMTNSARAKYPWSLVNDDHTGRMEYCRRGGYSSCTHWFGEMPIGENRVNQYSFPGMWDNHGDATPDRFSTNPQEIRTGPVGKYNSFAQAESVTPIGHNTRLDRLTRLVWNEGQGHEQLWSLLGLQQSLREGELANPGFVAYALLAKAIATRVPVVLVYRQDASTPLTQNEIDLMASQISAY